MRKINQLAIGIFIGLLSPIIFGFAVLIVANPSQLTTLTSVYSNVPAMLANTYLEAAVLSNEPEQAIKILRKQAGYARMLGNNNLMKRRLVEDTYMVYQSTVEKDGYRVLSIWMDELQELLGTYDSYWFNVMRNHIDVVTNRKMPDTEKTNVASMFPAFALPYRPDMESAIKAENYDFLKILCDKYSEAHYNFVALNPYLRNRYGRSRYDGSIILLGDNTSESSISYGAHPAFLTKDFVLYRFRVNRENPTRDLRLSFRSIPGVKMKLKSIVFEKDQKKVVYTQDDLLYLGKHGFVLGDGSYLISGNMQADVLALFPRNGMFPVSDAIIFSLQFEKLSLVNYNDC